MKRAFTLLVLLTTFGLMLPSTAEAAPRRDKNKSSHVSKHRHQGKGGSFVARRRDGRDHGRVVAVRHHHHGYVRAAARPGPVLAARPAPVPAPRPYYYGPRRGLLWFLFRL